MPTYQYACTACTEQFEVVQKFSDASLTDCPSCQGRLRKVFSPVGIVFKGSGFYRNDSRSSSSSASTTASASNGSKDSGKDSSSDSSTSKSDTSKPDTAKSDTAKSGTKAPASATSAA